MLLNFVGKMTPKELEAMYEHMIRKAFFEALDKKLV